MQQSSEGPQYPATSLGMTNPARVLANIQARTAQLEAGKYASSGPMELGGGRYRIDAQRPGTMVTTSQATDDNHPGDWVDGASQGQMTDAYPSTELPSAASGEKYRAAGVTPQRPPKQVIEGPANAHRGSVLDASVAGRGRMNNEMRAANFTDGYGRAVSR